MIEMIRQGLKEEGFNVSISKLCQWFGSKRPLSTVLRYS